MAPGARSGRRVKAAPGARSARRANGRSGRGATSGGGVPVTPIVVGVGTILTGLLFMWLVAPTLWTDREAPAPPEPPPPAPTAAATTSTTTSTTTTTTTTTTEPPFEGWVDPATSGQQWGDEVEGLLTFRGNPTRTYYGKGPVPDSPEVLWYFPPGPAMCSLSEVKEETTNWCGTGWTGQPAVFERDGATWVVVGAYDKAVHFLDADTGDRIVGDFDTGDLIKGSVTIDPDGYPLVYFGSRDNKYRVVAFDRDEPEELWALDAYSVSPTRWNDDWDGAGLVLDDYLFVGGENSRFHIVKLNRGYDGETGLATADPELVFDAPGWDDELIEAVGSNVSIESSVAISGDTAYFANSGGLIQGWDIAGLASGEAPERVFRYWAGDDIDATLVIDAEGMIYAGVEYERGNARSEEVGQIIKLDPSRDDPLVWSVHERPRLNSGVWATPGLHRDLLIVPTDTGKVLGLDAATGEVRWTKELPGPTWSSPVIVDDVWIQGDCRGWLRAFDVSDTAAEPPELWRVDLQACIESTPAVWDGLVVVGTRGGWIYAVG